MVPGAWSLEVVTKFFVVTAFEWEPCGSTRKWHGVILWTSKPLRRAIACIYGGERTAVMLEAVVECEMSIRVLGVGGVEVWLRSRVAEYGLRTSSCQL